MKTHCKWGHPFSGDNLFISTNGRRVCIVCRNRNTAAWVARDPERNRKKQLDWYYALTPAEKKLRDLKGRRRIYGLTPEQYDAKLIAQNNLCGLCGKPFDRAKHGLFPSLDHNHKTNKLRDFCHRNCNVAIGLLQDDPDICIKAAEYLRRHLESIMANSEGRKGGMNFHPRQLQRVWKPKDAPKAGATVCEHLNEPFECSICRRRHASRL